MIDLSQATWRKATRSGQSNGGCVEIASNFAAVAAVRDSKSPALGAHVIDRASFGAFLRDVKAGHYDL